MKPKNFYKLSNFTFDANALEARSYGHWVFFKVIDGKNVFNEYRYSITTSKHQHKLRLLLADLGIPIDVYVNTRLGLNDPNALKDSADTYRRIENSLVQLTLKRGTRKSTNGVRMKQAFKAMHKAIAVEAMASAQASKACQYLKAVNQ